MTSNQKITSVANSQYIWRERFAKGILIYKLWTGDLYAANRNIIPHTRDFMSLIELLGVLSAITYPIHLLFL